MARPTEENLRASLAADLQPGEQIQFVAYGIKQPNIFLMVLLLGGLLSALLTKHYVLALTDRRLVIKEINMGLFSLDFTKAKSITSYTPQELAQFPVKTSTGPIFTHIRIDAPNRFVAKFHRLASKNAREHAMGIAAALERARGAQQLAA